MKMLLIVFRESLEEEIHGLLNKYDVKTFTELHKVGGVGITGTAFHAFMGPGGNGMILTALSEDHAERVVEGFKVFRDQRLQKLHGARVPVHVFVLPCSQAV